MRTPPFPVPLRLLFGCVTVVDPQEDTELDLSVERGFIVARARVYRGPAVYSTQAHVRSVRLEGDDLGQWLVIDMPELPSVEAGGDVLASLGMRLANAFRKQVPLETLAPQISKALPGFMAEQSMVLLPLPAGRLPKPLACMLAWGLSFEVLPSQGEYLRLVLECNRT